MFTQKNTSYVHFTDCNKNKKGKSNLIFSYDKCEWIQELVL